MSVQELKQKLISLWVFIDVRIGNLSILWQIIKIINALYLIMIVLQDLVMTYTNGTKMQSVMKAIYSYLQAKDTNGECIQEIGYVLSGLFLLLILCTIAQLILEINLTNVKKRSKFVTFAIYYPIFIIILVEFCYSFISYFIIISFKTLHKDTMYTLVASIFSLLLLMIVSFYNFNTRIYSLALFLIVAIISMMTGINVVILTSGITVLIMYRDKDIVSRSIYGCFLVAQIFKLIEILSNDNGIEQLIFLGSALIFMIAAVIGKSIFVVETDTDRKNNSFLVECVEYLDKNSPQNLTNHQYINIEYIFRDFVCKYKQEMDMQMLYKINKYSVKHITYQEFIDIVDTKLKLDCEKSPNDIELKQLFFTFRITNIYKIHDTLNEISQFMDCSDSTKKLSTKEICLKKSIELMIMEEFMSKQPDNEKIHDLINLSKLQAQFVEKSMEIFSNVYSFWEKMQMDMLLEGIIEDNFHVILRDMQMLKKIVYQLKKGYKATWETKIMNIIIKLLEPHSVIKEIEGGSKYSQIKQQTLIFFVLRNKKIVQVSPSFLKIVNCAYEQIINENISKVVPEEIIKITKEKQYEAIKSSKASNIMPIVCQDHTIKIYQANVKLQPKTNSGIQFFYFLKKYENEEKFAFLYVNSVDLVVKYVSDEFYDIFGLTKAEAKHKFKKEEIFLNNIITNYMPDQVIKELNIKKSVRCDFSVKSIRTRKKKSVTENKYSGFLNLYATFQNYLLVYINITRNEGDNNTENGDTHKEKTEKSLAKTHKSHKTAQFKTEDNQSKMMDIIENSVNVSIGYGMKHSFHSDENNFQNNKPFAQKIEQKQAEISSEAKTNFFTYSNCIKALSVLLVILILVMPSLLIAFSQQRQGMIENIIQNVEKSTSHSKLLIKATFQIFFQYVVSDNIDFFQQFIVDQKNLNPNLNVSSVEQILKLQYEYIHSIIYNFHQIFTTFFYRSYLPSAYELIFKDFTVNADFSTSNLIDYSYNLKLASEQVRVQHETSLSENKTFVQSQQNDVSPLWFLLKNYPTIAQIQAPFQSVSILTYQFQYQLYVLKIIIYSLSGVYFLVLLIICYSIRCKLQIVMDIFHIFAITQKVDIEKRIDQLQRGTEVYLTQVPKDSLRKMAKLNLTKERTMLLYQTTMRSSLKELKQKYQEVKPEQQQKQRKVISTKNNTVIASFKEIGGIVLVTAGLFFVLGAFLFELHSNIEVDNIIFEYYNELNWIQYKELKSSCDMLHQKLSKSILNQTIDIIDLTKNKQISVDKILSNSYKKIFADYFEEQDVLLKQNLCENQQNNVANERFMALVNCSEIGFGILELGINQAQQYFDYTTIQMVNSNMSVLDTNLNESYPNILTHIESKERIFNQLQLLKETLFKQQQEISSKNNEVVLILAVLCFLGSFIIAGYLIAKFIPDIMKIKTIGMGYFKILSKETLSRANICQYASEKKLLDRISLL